MPETYSAIMGSLNKKDNSNQSLSNPVSFADFVRNVRANNVDLMRSIDFSKTTDGINPECLSFEAKKLLIL